MGSSRAVSREHTASAWRFPRDAWSPCSDVSANGAQVQSERPLRPGSRVHVRVAARNWTLAVAADVVRCSVWFVAGGCVIYRGALRFEEACAAVWEEQADASAPQARRRRSRAQRHR